MIDPTVLIGRVVGTIVYAWLVYTYVFAVLQLTAFLPLAALLIVLALTSGTVIAWSPWERICSDSPISGSEKPAVEGGASQSQIES